ncbi:MAG: hypothetical protein ACREGB_02150, partial [Candidatus Saccharimonadales bacterium]
QEVLGQAFAFGIITTIRQKGIGHAPGIWKEWIGYGRSITGQNSKDMVDLAYQYYQSNVGHTGAALHYIIEGILEPSNDHMQKVDVISKTKWGGQCDMTLGWTQQDMYDNIILGFPTDWHGYDTRAAILRSRTGRILVRGVAMGFTKYILRDGIPGYVPEDPHDQDYIENNPFTGFKHKGPLIARFY